MLRFMSMVYIVTNHSLQQQQQRKNKQSVDHMWNKTKLLYDVKFSLIPKDY